MEIAHHLSSILVSQALTTRQEAENVEVYTNLNQGPQPGFIRGLTLQNRVVDQNQPQNRVPSRELLNLSVSTIAQSDKIEISLCRCAAQRGAIAMVFYGIKGLRE